VIPDRDAVDQHHRGDLFGDHGRARRGRGDYRDGIARLVQHHFRMLGDDALLREQAEQAQRKVGFACALDTQAQS
jgi:hypothetical protein